MSLITPKLSAKETNDHQVCNRVRRVEPSGQRDYRNGKPQDNHHRNNHNGRISYSSSRDPLLGKPHENSLTLNHVASVLDNSLVDNYSREEVICNKFKACGTPEGNHHTAGITTITNPTLVPISESTNTRPLAVLSLITNGGASMLPMYL